MGSETVMNVKITDKQANRTTEDKTSDPFDENKFLTNCLMVAFDEIFRWRNFFAVQYVLTSAVLSMRYVLTSPYWSAASQWWSSSSMCKQRWRYPPLFERGFWARHLPWSSGFSPFCTCLSVLSPSLALSPTSNQKKKGGGGSVQS